MWFRVYAEMVDDDKLGLLSFEDRWHYVALLCCKAKGLLDPSDEFMLEKVRKKLGLSLKDLGKLADRLARVRLIDRQSLEPIAWDKRQRKSDGDATNAERQKRYRNAKSNDRNALRNVNSNALRNGDDEPSRNRGVTRPEAEAEAETEKEEALTPPDSAPPAPAAAETAALLVAQSAQNPEEPEVTRHGAIAVLLRSQGIATHSAHPQVHEWAQAGVTDEQLREALAIARQRKGKEPIPVAYLAPIVEDILAPKKRAAPGWATSDEGITRRARELGIPESRWPGTYAELRAMCHEHERRAA